MTDSQAPARPISRLDEARAGNGWRASLYRVPVFGTLAFVISPPRTKAPSITRRAISWSSLAVAVLGLGMMAYPWVGESYPFFFRIPVEKGIEWSNFLSDREANRIQDDLKARFDKDAKVVAAAEGDPVTQLRIPKLGVDAVVVEGTSPSALKAGAGHYPETPLPGTPGNVSIAGHRTTYGRPFNRIDELRTGDQIILRTPKGVYTYELQRDPWFTTPFDFGVIAPVQGESVLTLTTCHPKGSAAKRLIVRAKLAKTEPVARKKAA